MRKFIAGAVVLGTLVVGIVIVRALGASEITVTLRDVPAATVTGGQPDALALDFTIAAPRGDRFDALFVKQEGSAKWLTDLTEAKLWADAGASGFQGISIDRVLVVGSWNTNENGWAFTGLDESVSETGSRLFVTVSTASRPTNETTIQLSIPPFRDEATPMTYDTGDRGIFLRTVRPAPPATLTNLWRQSIQSSATDDRAPLVRITEPSAGASLGQDWLLVRGIARDSGGSAVSRVRVGINRVGRAITWADATPEVAGFLTWEARLFELRTPETYELRVQGEDWAGNRSAVSEPVTVTLTK